MCKIRLDLNTTTPTGTVIRSAIGQYRKVGDIWEDKNEFLIILDNPETPDITVLGNYELRVNVTNNIDSNSGWSPLSTFSIKSDCDGTPSTPPAEVCHWYTLIPNNEKQNWGVDFISVNYTACDGTDTTKTLSKGDGDFSFCASRVWSTVLNADHQIQGGFSVGPSPVNIGSLGSISTDDGKLENNNGNDICSQSNTDTLYIGSHTVLNGGAGSTWVNSVWGEARPRYEIAQEAHELMRFLTGEGQITEGIWYRLSEPSYKVYDENRNEVMDINRTGNSLVRIKPYDESQLVVQWIEVQPSGQGATGILGYAKL